VRQALALAAGAFVLAGPAAAATSVQVRQLATEAPTNPAALADLRSVTVVDGQHVDLARALRTSSQQELVARLRVLAAPSTPVQAFAARAQARRILNESRFRGSPVPRPFHSALVWLGERFSPVSRAFHRLGRQVPGGDAALWAILAALVVVLSAVVASRTARRRGASLLERGELARRPTAVDPRQLERAADEAEASGDPAAALRLRFRAGLLRLGRARIIPLRDSLTSGEARRLLRLHEFDLLAATHDDVVYGGRPARREDAVDAREHWSSVLRSKGVGA
jgi:hypothetical protein